MHTVINGQPVDCAIAWGNCHQVVRDYAAFEVDGQRYPGGQTQYTDSACTEKLPWFARFQDAVGYLEAQPWTGHILTCVMEEDGGGPSWITNGVHYQKRHGDACHPLLLGNTKEALNNGNAE